MCSAKVTTPVEQKSWKSKMFLENVASCEAEVAQNFQNEYLKVYWKEFFHSFGNFKIGNDLQEPLLALLRITAENGEMGSSHYKIHL